MTAIRPPLTLAVLALATTAGAAGLPAAWSIEFVARSEEDSTLPHFEMFPGASLEDQNIVIDDSGTVAVRTVFTSGAFRGGVFVGPEPAIPGIGRFLLLRGAFEDPLSPDIDLFGGRLAALVPDPVDAGTSGSGRIEVLDTFTEITVAAYPTEHPYYPEDTVSLAWNDAVGAHTRIGLAGYAISLDEPGPPRQTRILISTLDDGNDPTDFIGPMMAPWSNTFVSVEQPYFETPPGPPRSLVTVQPAEGLEGRIRTVLATADGDLDRIAGNAGIAHDDRVAFISRRSADAVWQVSRIDAAGEPRVRIADLPAFDEASIDDATNRPAINTNGAVAFRSPNADGAASLAVGDGDDLVVIAAPGDVVDTDLGPIALGFTTPDGPRAINGRVDINNSDQVAFTAWLANGTIGVFIATPLDDPACGPADLADPLGVLDLADIQAFVSGFLAQDPIADLAAPEGVFDLADLQAFVGAFTAGCP